MNVAATLTVLVAGTVAEIWNPPPYRRWPVLTLTTALLIGLTVALVSAQPDLLASLARDPRMVSAGQVWRAVTALFAQDADTAGIVFNLFWLLVLGTTAERRFSRWGWLAVYFGGGIVTEFAALAWQPHGAGNSIACFALAGALCSDWREGRWRWWRAGAGLTGLAAAAVLLFENDIHGIGFVAGLVIGFVLVATSAPVAGHEIGESSDRPAMRIVAGTDTVH